MKKLINAVEDVVVDSLRGVAAAHPHCLKVDLDHRIVLRASGPVNGKVGLVSGGGSDTSRCTRATSDGDARRRMLRRGLHLPVPDQITEATKAVDGGAGVLHIVKNYTGDVMNFDMAAEMASMEAGTRVGSVVIADDVAVQDSLYTAGRRGVGLTVLAEKILGAAAEDKRDLDALLELAQRINDGGRSFGVALTSCTVPAAGKPTFDLDENKIEMGVGIHGEPGRETATLGTAAEVAAQIVEPILADRDFTTTPVIAMLNGMGGTPLIEQYLVWGEIAKILAGKGVKVAHTLVGNHMTSLEMAGCSLTLLSADDDLLTLWDAPVETPGLRWGC